MVKTYRARKGKKPLTILNLHELVATVKWNFLNGAKEYASRVDTSLHDERIQASEQVHSNGHRKACSVRTVPPMPDGHGHALPLHQRHRVVPVRGGERAGQPTSTPRSWTKS